VICLTEYPLQHFYLPIQRALLHGSCNTNLEWRNPTTVQEWKDDPSCKLDALVEILQYHLNSGNHPPLCVDKNTLIPKLSGVPNPQVLQDKIVVYVDFLSSNIQLLTVSPFLNLPIVE
jgi:hypothetical protein